MRHLIGVLLFCLAVSAAAHPDPFPAAARSYVVELDGAVLWERQAGRQLPPASLTKLMTALLALEHGQPQAVVTVSPAAAHETGSRIGLRAGETFHAADLLAATLIASANDACHALADSVAGSELRFVHLMNERAKQLGMHDTRFTNACGHDAKGHHSSARDLARLADTALKQPGLLAVTSRIEATISTLDGTRNYRFENKNELIGRYVGAFGLKSGYTANAGKCLIAYAKRGEQRVLLVMLDGRNRWWDAVEILDAAFEHASQH
jgi:D-alanyl-D-alanine carboxypeptidase (penicillin-binding protein 5/6)